MELDISLDLYKIFCAVVRTGNMSAAAKALYISQPAVSMAIRQLEDRIGSTLLIRTTKGVRATPEGKVLYEYLEQALKLIKTAEHKYCEMVELEKGEIRIGASDTVISNYLMPYLEKYNMLYPNINIKVTNKTTFESLKLLKSGEVDLCFVNLPIAKESDLEVIECRKIHDCLIGGTKYRDLAQKGIDIHSLSDYPILLLEESSNSRKFLDQFAQKHGVVLKPIIELGSTDILIDFTRINLGLSFTIKEFLKFEDRKSIFEIPVYPEIPARAVGMVYLKNVTLPNAAKGFIELLHLN
ncbi:MAG: LysR family transcriptional regulator [Clostridiales bacterium]|nr:LysR family transcriptional regulator [Clostridiales bacterium]